MLLSKSQVTKWKPDFISLNSAEVSAGKEKADLEEKLKKLREEGRAATAFVQNAVIKFLTREASLAQHLSAQNVKLT